MSVNVLPGRVGPKIRLETPEFVSPDVLRQPPIWWVALVTKITYKVTSVPKQQFESKLNPKCIEIPAINNRDSLFMDDYPVPINLKDNIHNLSATAKLHQPTIICHFDHHAARKCCNMLKAYKFSPHLVSGLISLKA